MDHYASYGHKDFYIATAINLKLLKITLKTKK